MMRMATEAEWIARVAEWRASGVSARDFCERKDYAARGLQWWASQLRRRGDFKPVRAKPEVVLARVVCKAPARPTVQGAALVVDLAGARVEVREGVDRQLLSFVFDVLRTGRGGVSA